MISQSGSESFREREIDGRGRVRKKEGTLGKPVQCLTKMKPTIKLTFGEHKRERSSLGPVHQTPPCQVASLAASWPLALVASSRLINMRQLDWTVCKYWANMEWAPNTRKIYSTINARIPVLQLIIYATSNWLSKHQWGIVAGVVVVMFAKVT